MTPRDFIYWLQGYFEIPHQEQPLAISAQQLIIIRRHLAMLPLARYDHRRLSNPEFGEGFCLWLESYIQADEQELSAARTLAIRQNLDSLFDHVVAAQNALMHSHFHEPGASNPGQNQKSTP